MSVLETGLKVIGGFLLENFVRTETVSSRLINSLSCGEAKLRRSRKKQNNEETGKIGVK